MAIERKDEHATLREVWDWLPDGDDGDVGEEDTGGTEPAVDPDLDFPDPGGEPGRLGGRQPRQRPSTDWLPERGDRGSDRSRSRLVTFNGISGVTGDYWTPPLSEDELATLLQPVPPDAEELAIIRATIKSREAQRRKRALKYGVDPKDLAEAGWGVIFPGDGDPAIVRALEPLLELRREQSQDLYEEYRGRGGYRPNESAQKFLRRHGGGTGPVDPTRMPYYLLLVGSPEEIPYHFQTQLGVRHAVGRIHFDTPEEYGNYARGVERAERRPTCQEPEVVFFSSANEGDDATQAAHGELIEPLVNALKLSGLPAPLGAVGVFLRDVAGGASPAVPSGLPPEVGEILEGLREAVG